MLTQAPQFERTAMLIGESGVRRLGEASVAVFGAGGVGGFVAEALARAGVGTFELVDQDVVSESNINRQIIALHSTVGRAKVDVLKERILDINPRAVVNTAALFFLPENSARFDFSRYDYVVDAVDTVTAKIEIIRAAKAAGAPVISCMGTGNKLDPCAFRVADISETSVCPLARVMRRELAGRGITGVKCVYSTEPPRKPARPSGENRARSAAPQTAAPRPARERKFEKAVPASVSFVPPAAALLIAAEVVKDLTAGL